MVDVNREMKFFVKIQKIEVFVKIQKKKKKFFFWGGGGGGSW